MRNDELTSVDFGTMSKDEADRFKSRIAHKSFYNFNVEICPFQGNLCVTVTTDYDFLPEQNAELQVATMVARILNEEPQTKTLDEARKLLDAYERTVRRIERDEYTNGKISKEETAAADKRTYDRIRKSLLDSLTEAK